MPTDEQVKSELDMLTRDLSLLVHINSDQLIREDTLGTELSFRRGKPYFDRTLKLFHDLADHDLSKFPNAVLQVFNKQVNPALSAFGEIKSFSVSQPSPAQRRDQLINSVRDAYDSQFGAITPWLTYLSQQSGDTKALEAKARAIVDEMDVLQAGEKERHEKTQKEVDEILGTIRKAAAKVGVSQHAIHFSDEAGIHHKASWWWLGATVVFGMGAAGYALWSFSGTPEPAEGTSLIGHYLHYGIPRILTLSVIFYALSLSVKNYMAHRHNEVINRHRQNALRTFEAFVKAASDNQTKDAVLLRATEAIFSPQGTGYISSDAGAKVPSTMLEVIRGASEQR